MPNGPGGVYDPGHDRLQSVDLTRKYPPHNHVYNTTKRLIGGKFQAATDPTFGIRSRYSNFRKGGTIRPGRST